jgi:hypothetical protein
VIEGNGTLPGKVNYFLGSDWITDIPTFSEVRYGDIYPQIDLIVHGKEKNLEYDFVVRPGGDPGLINVEFKGILELEPMADGQLAMKTGLSEIIQAEPVTYQLKGGERQAVSSQYVLKGPHQVGIEVGPYDRSRRLIIDPVLSYSTYLGGSEDDLAYKVTIDSSGGTYIAGATASPDFPTTDGGQGQRRGLDVFVSKLDPTGSTLIFTTFIGGEGDERCLDLALDEEGIMYLTGETASFAFPVTPESVFQTFKGGGYSGFVSKLGSMGDELLFSTFLGGAVDDKGTGIAVDEKGDVIVAGRTSSSDFPVTADAVQTKRKGQSDAFVSKIAFNGLKLLYSTFLGGSGVDEALDMALDGEGRAYLTGRTLSADFPIVLGAQSEFGGSADAFVSQIDFDGLVIESDEEEEEEDVEPEIRHLVYSTFLGGSEVDAANAIALGRNGGFSVAGMTASTDFPTRLPLQSENGGGKDGFITQFDPLGTGILFSTYLGGSGSDSSTDLALGSVQDIYVIGTTTSADFPLKKAFQSVIGGQQDAFIAKVDMSKLEFGYSSYLGGSQMDSGMSVGVDPAENVYLVGYTQSSDFPVTSLQGSLGGGTDAFVTRITETNTLYYAHFGDGVLLGGGGSVKSQVRLLNLDTNLITKAKIEITRSDGQPMTVNLNGETVEGEVEVSLPPEGALTLASNGAGQLQEGWVRVTSETGLAGVILFESTAGTAGVGSSEPTTKFVAPVQANAQIATGIAVANLGNAQMLQLELLDEGGNVVAVAEDQIGAEQHFARLIPEFDWDPTPDLSSFLGSLVVSGQAELIATVLLVTPGEFATLPVTPRD